MTTFTADIEVYTNCRMYFLAGVIPVIVKTLKNTCAPSTSKQKDIVCLHVLILNFNRHIECKDQVVISYSTPSRCDGVIEMIRYLFLKPPGTLSGSYGTQDGGKVFDCTPLPYPSQSCHPPYPP